MHSNATPTLVLGAAGKTGRRVLDRLTRAGVPTRAARRSGPLRFDWDDPTTWRPALDGAGAVYVTYQPDLLLPEAAPRVGAFAAMARELGARRLVMLSGRGEVGARRAEEALERSGADWTIVRASWFAQNFSESFLVEPVLAGEVALPAGDVGEPFVDADDIADVAVASLLDDAHVGRAYDLTGPRLLTFREAVAEVANAAGRPIRYVELTHARFRAGLDAAGVPAAYRAILVELFEQVLDGRNAHVTDDVARVLGRPARDFTDYARAAAATGVWERAAA